MATALTFNDRAALIGDLDGNVATVVNPSDISSREWKDLIRGRYSEPEHWYPDEEGAPFTRHTGGYWHDEKGNMVVEVEEGTVQYKVFEDTQFELSVRAAFLPNIRLWVVADRKREQA